jgi:hypothetical protein
MSVLSRLQQRDVRNRTTSVLNESPATTPLRAALAVWLRDGTTTVTDDIEQTHDWCEITFVTADTTSWWRRHANAHTFDGEGVSVHNYGDLLMVQPTGQSICFVSDWIEKAHANLV